MDKKTDELSLFDFFVMCGQGIANVCKWMCCTFLKTLRMTFQNIWLVGFCSAIGLGIGYYFSRWSVAEYEYTTTITYNKGMDPFIRSGLRQFFSTPHNILRANYGVDSLLLKKYNGVEYYNIIDANANVIIVAEGHFNEGGQQYLANVHDNTLLNPDFIDFGHSIAESDASHTIMKDRLCMVLSFDGMRDLEPFKNAIVRFLNRQESIVAADKNFRAIQEQHLAHLEQEVQRLDSLCNHEYFVNDSYTQMRGNNSNLISQGESQQVYFDKMLMVIKKRDFLKAQLLNSPELINFQTNFYSRPNIKRIYKWAMGLIGGYLFGLCLAALWRNRKKVIEYMKEK